MNDKLILVPIIYLAAVNLITFFVFGWDKRCAKKQRRRVPERTLFSLAAMGGSIGALLGMRVFHHKTLHNSFRFGIPAILLAQLVVVGLLFWAAQK